MIKNRVTILDVGSSGVTALIGERGINNTFTVLSAARREYDGFAEGRFFDVGEFCGAVQRAVGELAENIKADVKKIYVGVPGAFVRLENRKYKIAYKGKKKIKQVDIDDLFDAGRAAVEKEGYEVISHSDVYFVLDDNRKVFDPVGNISSMLGGNLTYILCEKYFTDAVRKALSGIKADKIKFVFDGNAEGLYLLDREMREFPSLIIDVGYITTCFSIVLGNGILATQSVDFGGGMLTARFVEKFDLDFDDAEKLKRMVNFGISKGANSFYSLETDDGIRQLPVGEVHGQVCKGLEELAAYTEKFVAENSNKVKSVIKLYLTGGGITYIRGAKDYFASKLGVHVEILSPNVSGYNKAGDCSVISLLDYALNDNNEKKRFFSDFFKF
ncbi:MAG TPA: hypothetical protein DDW54_02490 [Clostridiales bacterium]|nr:hypothetical protein [Clostridiales bacterium]